MDRGGLRVPGREAEAVVLEEFLGPLIERAPGQRVLVLEGDAGIGKTHLWRAAGRWAGERGAAVLSSRPSELATTSALVTVGDLLEALSSLLGDGDGDGVAAAPEPTGSARQEHGGDGAPARPGDVGALGQRFLAALRSAAGRRPVLLAVDDVQWIDPGSAAVLDHALRRLRPEDAVRVLLTRRTGRGQGPLDLRQTLPADECAVLRVGPLAPAAVRVVLRERVGVEVGARLAERLLDLAAGNTFHVVELAAELSRGDRLEQVLGDVRELPLPDGLAGLLRARLAAGSGSASAAVVAVALLADPLDRVVHEALGATCVIEAVDRGLLVADGARLRLFHPLAGTVALGMLAPEQVRTVHGRLAEVVDSPVDRLVHRAHSVAEPDESLAAALAEQVETVALQGGAAVAGELAELSWRCTSRSDSALKAERLVTAATWWTEAGAFAHARALLEPELELVAPGPVQARLLFLLEQCRAPDVSTALVERVLRVADPPLRVQVLAEAAFYRALGLVRPDTARAWAEEALQAAERLGPQSHAAALFTAGWIDALDGTTRPGRTPDLGVWEAARGPVHDHPDRLAAVRALWRGDVDTAGRLLTSLELLAAQRQDAWSRATVLNHRVELETRRGDQRALSPLVEEFIDSVRPLRSSRAVRQRALAGLYLAAAHPPPVGAEAEGSELADWHQIDLLRLVGLSALLHAQAARAVAALGAVHQRVEAAGVIDPGAFPVAADLVEALAAAAPVDPTALPRAQVVLAVLRERAAQLQHPWAAAVCGRAAAALHLAAGEDVAAEDALRDSLDRLTDLRLPLDRARAELALGALLRRAGRRREARRLLESAGDFADQLGVPAVSGSARAQLVVLSGRRPSTGVLTPAEHRVADLVSQGLTNAETAARLFVSVATVEAHLTRVYAKLAVRSRTELALRFPGTEG